MAQPLFKELSQKDGCFKPGSTLCQGCMESVAFNNLGKATDNGRKTIFTIGTGCGEVSTLAWPGVVAWGRGNESPEDVRKSFSIIHNVFESAPTVAEAVRDVSDHLLQLGALDMPVNVVSMSGDGGALAIGLRSFLHTINRRSRITLFILINEFYANTGFQYAPSTTLHADTATTPVGKHESGNIQPPMDYIGLAMMAGADFVAQVSPAFPKDFADATTRALEAKGTAVIFVPSPCIAGWKFEEGRTIELARLATKSGLFPVFVKAAGEAGTVRHVDVPKNRRNALIQFMAAQRRFAHIVQLDSKTEQPIFGPGGEGEIGQIENWITEHLMHLEALAQLHVKRPVDLPPSVTAAV